MPIALLGNIDNSLLLFRLKCLNPSLVPYDLMRVNFAPAIRGIATLSVGIRFYVDVTQNLTFPRSSALATTLQHQLRRV